MVMNITGYRFVELPDRDAFKIALREECLRLGLKGLILLAPEGTNYFLAGSKQATDGFRHYLDGPSGAAGTLLGGRFANIPCKESLSSKAPFKRMLVKVKKEIISLGIESVSFSTPRQRFTAVVPPPRIMQATEAGHRFGFFLTPAFNVFRSSPRSVPACVSRPRS